MNTPRVPLRPESIEQLRARYPQAIAEMIQQLDVLAGAKPAPSGDPVHVFDTEDGLRLIISLEQTPKGRVGVHLSASFHNTLHTLERCSTLDALVCWIGDSWRAIAGSTRIPEFLGMSEGGIPHFFVERGC